MVEENFYPPTMKLCAESIVAFRAPLRLLYSLGQGDISLEGARRAQVAG